MSDSKCDAEPLEAYKRPKPCRAGRQVIFAFAEKIALALNLKTGDDLEKLVAQRLPGKIENLPGSKKQEKASITVKSGGDFIIRLFSSLFPLPLQRRMSVAHELGHFFLHSRYGEEELEAFCDAEDEDEAAEKEASEFARAFLVPTALLNKAVDCFGRDSIQVAAHFMVPESVARQRMVDIGRVPESVARQRMVDIGRR